MINNYLTINANNVRKQENNRNLPKASRPPSPNKNETVETETKTVLNKLKAKVDE